MAQFITSAAIAVLTFVSAFGQTSPPGEQPPGSFQITGQVANSSFRFSTPDGVLHEGYPSVIDIVNTTNQNICLNMYVFDGWPGSENSILSCCSTLIEPNKPYTVSTANQAYYGDPLNLAQVTWTRIKLLASTPLVVNNNSQRCNPSSPTSETLTSGLQASISEVQIPLQQPRLGCVPLSANSPCTPELTMFTEFCGFLLANGSGYGVCRGAKPADNALKPDWLTLYLFR